MLEVYIDAASAGNPGPSGIGIFIKGEGHQIQISEYIGETNNHIAEFTALVRGLEEAQKLGSLLSQCVQIPKSLSPLLKKNM